MLLTEKLLVLDKVHSDLSYSVVGHEFNNNDSRCYYWNVLCSPKIYMLKYFASHDGVKRWGLGECLNHEGRAFINRISAILKAEETPQRSLTPPLPPWRNTMNCATRKGLY